MFRLSIKSKEAISDLVDELVGVGGQLSIADNQAGAEKQEEGAESIHTLQKFVNELTNSY